MFIKPNTPAVIETEDEMLDRLFFPEFHGEVRIEYYDGKVLVINWYDNYPLNSCIYNLDNDRAKFWASTFVRLHEEYIKQRTEADFAKKLVEENQHLKEQVALLKQKIFGTSSEQTTIPTIENKEVQIGSIDAGIAAQSFIDQDKKLKLVSSNAGRKPLPANLPRERVEYKLPLEKQVCECCSGRLHEFGEEMTERLTVIPASINGNCPSSY